MYKIVLTAMCLLAVTLSYAQGDPMKPLPQSEGSQKSSSAAPLASLRVTSIIHSGGRKIATINEQLLSEGDSISGYTVSRIGSTQVLLLGASGRLTLTLNPNVKKSYVEHK